MPRSTQQDKPQEGADSVEVAQAAPDGTAAAAEGPTTASDVKQDDSHEPRTAGPDEGGDSPAVASKQTSDQDVTVTLAHPMDVGRAQHLGLDTEEGLSPGTQVTLHRNYARTLITSGYVTVDPEDADAVREALTVRKS